MGAVTFPLPMTSPPYTRENLTEDAGRLSSEDRNMFLP